LDQLIYVDKPLGYVTGPDTQLVSTGVSYQLPPALCVEVAYTFINKGEKNTESPYQETLGEKTPTGIPWRTHVVELGAEYSPFPFVSAGGSIYFVFDSNAGHQPGISRQDVQAAVHLTVKVGEIF
jgi:hypothetical protein